MDKNLQDAARRLVEEKLYDQVALEIAEKAIKPGLWAKAMQLTSGNKEKAEAEYIRLRVQNLLDESVVAEEIQGSPDDDESSLLEDIVKLAIAAPIFCGLVWLVLSY